MAKLTIERLGGFAGFGGNYSHLQSRGEIELDELSAEDKLAIDELFTATNNKSEKLGTDQFRYRISRQSVNGIEIIEAEEEKIPNTLKQIIRDELI